MVTPVIIELPRYRCHKEVRAVKIKEIYPGREDGKGPGATFVTDEPTCERISIGEIFVSKHNPQQGGYYVLYEDGYESFSPAAAFESGYTRIEV